MSSTNSWMGICKTHSGHKRLGGGGRRGGGGSVRVPSGATASPHPYLRGGSGRGQRLWGRPQDEPSGPAAYRDLGVCVCVLGGGFGARRIYAPMERARGQHSPGTCSCISVAEPQEGTAPSLALSGWGPCLGAGGTSRAMRWPNTPCLPNAAAGPAAPPGQAGDTQTHTRSPPPPTRGAAAASPTPGRESSLPAGPA